MLYKVTTLSKLNNIAINVINVIIWIFAFNAEFTLLSDILHFLYLDKSEIADKKTKFIVN